MKYLSVCSGIEAASVAWHDLGWTQVGFSEIDPFACAVLAERFPNVPNLGSLTDYASWSIEPGSVDVLVGGTPCQSFSVAGLRKGLDDPRGNLALVYLGLVDRLRPRYVVWENVPGVLSVDGGRAFGSFLGGLAQLGYGWAYRVMDAQYVRVESHPRAVPQRRRRVFVVGCAGADWQRAASILLEPEGVRGDSAPRREAGKEAPRGARPGAAGGGIAAVGNTLTQRMYKGPNTTLDEGQTLIPSTVAGGVAPAVAGTLGVRGTRSHTELDGHGAHVIAPLPFNTTQVTNALNRSNPQPGDPCHPLTRFGDPPAVAFQWPVDVADPITAVEGRTYTHEGTTFRTHNVVPDVIGFASNLGSQGGDVYEGKSPTLRVNSAAGVAHSADADKGDQDTLVAAISFYPNMGANARSDGAREGVAGTLAGAEGGNRQAVAAVSTGRGWWSESDVGATLRVQESPSKADTLLAAPTLTSANDPSRSPQSSEVTQQVAAVHTATMAVRRLTPRECERLQGFPDDWTAITYRGKSAADGPRYKALGNSMAVNVMRWIGERISAVDSQS